MDESFILQGGGLWSERELVLCAIVRQREDLALEVCMVCGDGSDGRGNITSGCDIGRKAVFGFFAKRPVSGKQMAIY